MSRLPNIHAVLDKLPEARIAVIGDFCLDVYWDMDVRSAQRSVETGLPTRPVLAQRTSLGGAGNVAHNLTALGATHVPIHGVVGCDPFGRHLRELCRCLDLPDATLLEQAEDWATHTYIKPLEDGQETNRIDFGNVNRLGEATARRLAANLAADLPNVRVAIINQQVASGIHRSSLFQELLQALILAHPETIFLLNSRDMSRRYAGTMRKVNAYEAVTLLGATLEPRTAVSLDEARVAGLRLAAEWQRPVVISRGAAGCLVIDGARVDQVPGVPATGETDPVGAGDSLVAGLAVALAVGGTLVEAAAFGNLVAGVTVRKLRQTGTATPDEIRSLAPKPTAR